jgi:DNA (cytosine-5)-methyltransferase 1
MPERSIPILSLFSGAGGLDYGFSKENFKVILACDNFEAAVESYNLNSKRKVAQKIDLSVVNPDAFYRLVDKVSSKFAPEGIIGGPPCQGFSRANVQSNPNDPRNLLPFRYAEILYALNKRYNLKFFVFENVMGLTTSKHATHFEAILKAFRRAGFYIFLQTLNAQDFGVPQLRRRLFLVGLNRSIYSKEDFAFPSGHVRKTTVRETIQGLPEPVYFQRGLQPSNFAYHPNHWTMMPKSVKFLSMSTTSGRSFRRIEWDEVSPTVAYGNREIHVHPDGGRRLSVLEAMLLQGFPSTYVLAGTLSQQITQVSNAVPPPLARALAREVRRSLRKEGE